MSKEVYFRFNAKRKDILLKNTDNIQRKVRNVQIIDE